MQKQQTGLTSPTCRTPPGQKHGHPPDSSRADLLHPGFDVTLLSYDTSTAIPENEDCAPSSRSPPDASRAPFPHRSPRRSSANAAYGGLQPPTAGRLRRAKPSSPAQHHVKKLYLQTELPSTFVAHVGPQIPCHLATLRSAVIRVGSRHDIWLLSQIRVISSGRPQQTPIATHRCGGGGQHGGSGQHRERFWKSVLGLGVRLDYQKNNIHRDVFCAGNTFLDTPHHQFPYLIDDSRLLRAYVLWRRIWDHACLCG